MKGTRIAYYWRFFGFFLLNFRIFGSDCRKFAFGAWFLGFLWDLFWFGGWLAVKEIGILKEIGLVGWDLRSQGILFGWCLEECCRFGWLWRKCRKFFWVFGWWITCFFFALRKSFLGILSLFFRKIWPFLEEMAAFFEYLWWNGSLLLVFAVLRCNGLVFCLVLIVFGIIVWRFLFLGVGFFFALKFYRRVWVGRVFLFVSGFCWRSFWFLIWGCRGRVGLECKCW